jgi:hypothetical protein
MFSKTKPWFYWGDDDMNDLILFAQMKAKQNKLDVKFDLYSVDEFVTVLMKCAELEREKMGVKH